MFWNRIGSPSTKERATGGDIDFDALDARCRMPCDWHFPVSGTLEEYGLARELHSKWGSPLVWVYFRTPTAKENDQLGPVLAFRKALEEEKDLFFREYAEAEEWEEIFRQHLVGYLNGLRRWSIDRNFIDMRPEHALMKGRFLAEAIYKVPGRVRVEADLDGDGKDETVVLYFSVNVFCLEVHKFDQKIRLEVPAQIYLEDYDVPEPDRRVPKMLHLAIKDVNNDGYPEILLCGTYDGLTSHSLAIYGFWHAQDEGRILDYESFGLLSVINATGEIFIWEGGTIVYPHHTSTRAATFYRWNGKEFEGVEKLDVDLP